MHEIVWYLIAAGFITTVLLIISDIQYNLRLKRFYIEREKMWKAKGLLLIWSDSW